ncbi:helix-turn-helix transcriptional regulator [Brevibacillus laterosporus]|uniref:helix-turn-helix domain-containing protein n=1 Tax=Brevibacillus laterosporus TaxID=1465 RepID=UPI003D191E1C
MSLGSRIKEFRLMRGLTQVQMAKKLNMTEANFSSYERDKSVPPSEKLNQIASILNVSTDYLLCRTNDPTIKSSAIEIDEEVRTLARDIQDLNSGDQELLKAMIQAMRQRGKEARNRK